jgi:hypothetical protein
MIVSRLRSNWFCSRGRKGNEHLTTSAVAAFMALNGARSGPRPRFARSARRGMTRPAPEGDIRYSPRKARLPEATAADVIGWLVRPLSSENVLSWKSCFAPPQCRKATKQRTRSNLLINQANDRIRNLFRFAVISAISDRGGLKARTIGRTMIRHRGGAP